MTTIKLTLSRRQKGEINYNEVYFRISLNRNQVFRIKTNIYVPKKFWSISKEKVILPRIHNENHVNLVHIQNRLDSLKNYIMEYIVNNPVKCINKECLNDLVHIFHYGVPKEQSDDTSFEAVFNLFISSQIKTEMRVRQFKCVLRMLKRFEIYRGNSFKLDISKFSDEDMVKFENFLRKEHTFFDEHGHCIKYAYIYTKCPETRVPKPRGGNAIFSILKRFRTFYNWAVKTGRTKNNPFKKYSLKECVYGTPFFMTVEEINYLFNFDLSPFPQLAVQRDVFVLQSCIGLRIGDFYNLTQDNIVNDFIEYIPSKTINESGRTVRVPLCSHAKTIIERYHTGQRSSLVPLISQQKYNQAIKKILRLAGITRIVTIINSTTRMEEQRPICDVATSHMARRNFIGNLYKNTQDPDSIGSMTGHVEGSKAFARYRTIDDSIKKKLITVFE